MKTILNGARRFMRAWTAIRGWIGVAIVITVLMLIGAQIQSIYDGRERDSIKLACETRVSTILAAKDRESQAREADLAAMKESVASTKALVDQTLEVVKAHTPQNQAISKKLDQLNRRSVDTLKESKANHNETVDVVKSLKPALSTEKLNQRIQRANEAVK